MNVLIIEDDENLAKALRYILEENDYIVELCQDGSSGLESAINNSYNVIVLDRMLPEIDGLTICKEIRRKNISTPIIMLTAMDTIENKLEGFDNGADDYMTKPFNPPELLAHIKALSRRKGELIKENLRFDDIELSTSTFELDCNKQKIKLDKAEYKIIETLIINNSEPTKKETLVIKVWGSNSFVGNNNLDTYITFLNNKLSFLKSNCSINKKDDYYFLTTNEND